MAIIVDGVNSAQLIPALLSCFDVQLHMAVVLLREDEAAAIAIGMALLSLQAASSLRSWLQ